MESEKLEKQLEGLIKSGCLDLRTIPEKWGSRCWDSDFVDTVSCQHEEGPSQNRNREDEEDQAAQDGDYMEVDKAAPIVTSPYMEFKRLFIEQLEKISSNYDAMDEDGDPSLKTLKVLLENLQELYAICQSWVSNEFEQQKEKEMKDHLAVESEEEEKEGMRVRGIESQKEESSSHISRFWCILGELGVSRKCLLAFLCHLMTHGCIDVNDIHNTVHAAESRLVLNRIKIVAASTYLHLMCLRGGRAYRMFHPLVFRRAVDLLSPHEILCVKSVHDLISCFRMVFEIFGMMSETESLNYAIDFLVGILQVGNDELSTSATETLCLLWDKASSCDLEVFNSTLKAAIPFIVLNWEGCVVSGPISKDTLKIGSMACQLVTSLMSKSPFAGDAVCIFLQHCCVRICDKSEYRTAVAGFLSAIIVQLSSERYCKMITWLQKYSKNVKVSFRLFFLELTFQLIVAHVDSDRDGKDENMAFLSSKEILLRLLLSRVSDKSSLVRSKSLVMIHNVLSLYKEDSVLPSFVKSTIFGEVSEFAHFTESNMDGNVSSGSLEQSVSVSLNSSFNVKLVNNPVEIFISRCGDEKPGVRKTAVMVMEALCFIDQDDMTKYLRCLSERCCDEAVSCRKQSFISLTNLFQVFGKLNQEVVSAWVFATLPMIVDCESSIYEKCEDTWLDFVLMPLCTKGKDAELSWGIIDLICSKDKSGDMLKYFQKLFSNWARSGKVPKELCAPILKKALEDNASAGSWVLLSNFAEFSLSKSSDLKLEKFIAIFDDMMVKERYCICLHVLKIISVLACSSNSKESLAYFSKFLGYLQKFKYPASIVSGVVDVMVMFSKKIETSAKDKLEKLFDLCQEKLRAMVFSAEAKFDEAKAITYMFTLGEICQLLPSKVTSDSAVLIESFIAPSINIDGQEKFVAIPASVRAIAFLSLGKLCIQDEELAKNCIAAMARELENCDDSVVKNNVVVVMCDLAQRYACLIDLYIPHISACLHDQNELVRRQTLILLTRLLQEDYVKWKGSLFFHFVSVLVDDSKETRSYAEYCLFELLLNRFPHVISNNFIETIFYLNNFTKNCPFNKALLSENIKLRYSICGQGSARNKRLYIYKEMLKRMDDEMKFMLNAKLCQEVLGFVVDGNMKLDNEAMSVLSDTLAILCSPDIKLSSLKSKDDEADDMDSKSAAMTKAKTKLISQIVKKNTIENIMPITIALKHKFEKERSPLLGSLMQYILTIMTDYKSEVSDILVADKQLAREIEFDMRKFEEQKQGRKSTGSPFRLPASPSLHRTPNLNTTGSSCGTPAFKKPSTPLRLSIGSASRAQTSAKKAPICSTPCSTLNSSEHVNQVGETAGLPSPIPSAIPLRLYSEHATPIVMKRGTPGSTSKESMVGFLTPLGINAKASSKSKKKTVISMLSPDAKAPAPRQWRVASPFKAASVNADDNDAEKSFEEEDQENVLSTNRTGTKREISQLTPTKIAKPPVSQRLRRSHRTGKL
eukprot:Nk52_evm55s224 gene=Nk52_evmTU55s224